jgi:hypothetical protein
MFSRPKREIRGFRDFRRHGDSRPRPGFAIFLPLIGENPRKFRWGKNKKRSYCI